MNSFQGLKSLWAAEKLVNRFSENSNQFFHKKKAKKNISHIIIAHSDIIKNIQLVRLSLFTRTWHIQHYALKRNNCEN
jgi:hypothetical protein